MPKSPTIIEGRPGQVKRGRFVRWSVPVMILTTAVFAACTSEEDRAREMYREGVRLAQEESLARAVEVFDEVAAEYPATEAGRDAKRDAILYRGLAESVDRFPVHRARDLMVDAARRVERWKSRNRRVPPDLAAVYGADPPPVDPWGRALSYRVLRDGRSYELATFGADGEPGGDGPAADLVVRDGSFVRSP